MAFATPDANGVIFQSGRDIDLSDLANNSGVTTTIDDGITYYDFGTNRLWILGTVWHDPDKEVMIFHHTSIADNVTTHVLRVEETASSRSWQNPTGWSVDGDGNYVITHTGHSVQVGDAIRVRLVTGSAIEQKQIRVSDVTANTITLERSSYWADIDAANSFTITANGQYTRIPIYNYGREYTSNGRTRYSDGTGVIISGNSTSQYDPDEHGFFFHSLAFLWSRGGTIVTNRPCSIEGHYDIKNTTFMCPRRTGSGNPEIVEMRSIGNGWWDNGKLININGLDPTGTKKFDIVLEGSAVTELLSNWYQFSMRDFDASKNANICDFGHDGSYGVNGTLVDGSYTGTTVTHHHHDYEIVNSATGSDIITMWRPEIRSSLAQRGNVATKKEVSFNIKDANNTAIEGVKLYLADNPSAYAKNATYPPAVSTGVYTTTPTFLNGVINANGSVTYDYTNPVEYNATSDVNGDIATLTITTSVHIHEYNANDPAAQNDYPELYVRANNSWALSPSNLRGPDFSDWDTDNFGGFYRVDRRSDSNTNADDFTFKFASYSHALATSTQTLKGLGKLQVKWVLFNDASITETNKATVDAYTTIDSSDQFYDRAKSYLYDNYTGETATIVTRNGATINASSYNIVVDASAASVFAFDGSTITIKSTQFVGNIISSGTFTLLNGAEILGTYGATTVSPWTVTNIEAGSTIQIYNVTQAIEIENYITSGTAGTKITATGSYSSSEATNGDTIRLRITCQAGVNALLPFESFGVATAAGITFRADQAADTVYDANNIDGSAITGITVTADYTNIQIDVDDNVAPYEITAQQIYNFYAYIITTTQGIANFYGAITPIDNMNYKINSSVVALKIQNTGTTDVVINGGRLYRDDNVSIIDTNSATGAGTGSLVHDTGFLLQYIQPQVEAAVGNLAQDSDMQTVKSDVANIKKNANLISALV